MSTLPSFRTHKSVRTLVLAGCSVIASVCIGCAPSLTLIDLTADTLRQTVVDREGGQYLALFHDDGRFIRAGGQVSKTMTLYRTYSHDGGVTWSEPEGIFSADTIHLCEPGIVRSPDGYQLAMLLRENTRTHNSFVMFSNDEGSHWSTPRELPAALTGNRHTAKYAPDGRLLISFRDMARHSPTYGDWVAWVGTYDDIVAWRDGEYRVRLKDNLRGSDCAYPGVEVLPDGTFVVTTYGHWTAEEQPYIISVRLRLDDLER